MRIILDQDQILAKWLERILEWWNEDHGTSLTVEDIKTWEIGPNLGPGGEYFVRSCCRYPGLYSNLEPVEGAIEGVKKLVYDGHDVVIASAVPKQATVAYTGKIEWIRRHLPFLDIDNFIAVKRKNLIHGDLIFDDAAHNIDDCHGKMLTVMLDRPWNRGINKTTPSAIVNDWNQFMSYVEKINKQTSK